MKLIKIHEKKYVIKILEKNWLILKKLKTKINIKLKKKFKR